MIFCLFYECHWAFYCVACIPIYVMHASPMIEIYSGSYCPYCVRAKQLFQQLNIEFSEYDIQKDPEKRQEMMLRSSGARSIPQIFIHNQHIGGCDDLYALHQQGKLSALLDKKES